MRKKSDTVRYTAKQIKAKVARGEDRTDWRKALRLDPRSPRAHCLVLYSRRDAKDRGTPHRKPRYRRSSRRTLRLMQRAAAVGPSSFASLFEDHRACSRRQAESQKIEMFEQWLDPGNPAFHFCAQKDSHRAREG
jgi:hypothetical protein